MVLTANCHWRHRHFSSMIRLIDLPSEVLIEICFYVFLIPESAAWAEDLVDLSTGESEVALQNRIDVIRNYCNSKIRTNSFVSNIDTLHSCEGTSLDKACDAISRVRCPYENIIPLSLTCKRLHAVIEPLLWGVVETHQGSKGAIGDLVRILSTMVRRPELGRHTKALAFGDFIPDDDDSPFSEKEEKEMTTILEWDTTHQFVALLDHLPNLRAMKFAIEIETDYFSAFQASTLYPSGFPLGLQNLTEFSFLWEEKDLDCDGLPAEMLLPLFLLPSLKTLYLGYIAAVVDKEDLQDFTQYYGTSPITALIIDCGLVEEPAITAYCKLPKLLERFEYAYRDRSNQISNAEPEDYLRALLPQNTCLNTLKIKGRRLMQTSDNDARTPDPNILRSFTSLTDFAFPVSFLLFRQRGVKEYKIQEVLPPNVEKVTLLAYDEWTFDGVDMMLKSFFTSGKTKFLSLREMNVQIWLQEHDYVLHAPKGRQSEAKSVIASRVESLKQRAKDKGIKLEVDLDRLSKT
ncbi:hypothetical protein V8E51_002748 [Hyaloscypha variabilis]